MEIGINLIIGIVGSILAAIIFGSFRIIYIKKIARKRKLKELQNKQIEIGKKILNQGLTKFHFSRDDYESTLASFIDKAENSISIVSISLKITDDEGQLSELFKRKLSAISSFKIEVSLINPNNQELVKVAADTLNISKEKLSKEITEMINDLLDCRESLNPSEKSRFNILVHDCFPMGSVLMIDTTTKSGMIQVETKLYKAPRTKSFGFQLTGESDFFKHNFVAWNRVIQESKAITKDQLIVK